MTTMNISLPESMKAFVDEQVSEGGFGTASEFVRGLIRKEQDRLLLRNLLLEGASSPLGTQVDDAWLEGLRAELGPRPEK
ncbi:MAG: ribbon-helix-helix domain-containing protein [Rhodospirillales bacterium]